MIVHTELLFRLDLKAIVENHTFSLESLKVYTGLKIMLVQYLYVKYFKYKKLYHNIA